MCRLEGYKTSMRIHFLKYFKEREMRYRKGKNLEENVSRKNLEKTLNKKSKEAARARIEHVAHATRKQLPRPVCHRRSSTNNR